MGQNITSHIIYFIAAAMRKTRASIKATYVSVFGNAPGNWATSTTFAPVEAATFSAILRLWYGSTRIAFTWAAFILAITSTRWEGDGGMPGLGSRKMSMLKPKRCAK